MKKHKLTAYEIQVIIDWLIQGKFHLLLIIRKIWIDSG